MHQVRFRSWLFTCFSENMMYIWHLCLRCVTLWPHLLVILDIMGYSTFCGGAWTSIWLPQIRHWLQTDPTQGSLGDPVGWYGLGQEYGWGPYMTQRQAIHWKVHRVWLMIQDSCVLLANCMTGKRLGQWSSLLSNWDCFSNFGKKSCDS